MSEDNEPRFDTWTAVVILLAVVLLMLATFELWIGHEGLPHY
jgi:hypothetical protein